MEQEQLTRIMLVENLPGEFAYERELLCEYCDVSLVGPEDNRKEAEYAFKPEILVISLSEDPLPGLAFIRHVREVVFNHHMYILVMLEPGQEDFTAMALDLGANAAMPRPSSDEQFKAVLDAAWRHVMLVRQMNAAYERIRGDLDQVAALQIRLLPHTPPDNPGVKLAHLYLPSSFASGDYFDWLTVRGRLRVVMADVSGHGVKAAFLMSLIKGVFHSTALTGQPLDQVLAAANALIMETSRDDGDFATILAMDIDTEARRIDYVNAGHCPGLLVHGNQTMELPAGESPVGFFPATYTVESLEYETPCRILLYTDGWYEWDLKPGEMLGLPRFLEISREAMASPLFHPDMLLERMESLPEMRPVFNDDLTAVFVELAGNGKEE